MSIGVECLLAEDVTIANRLAQQLDTFNQERRTLESRMQMEAFAIVDRMRFSDDVPAGLCLFDARWHQGIVGLVASRVKDKTHRPVIAFAKAEEGGFLKGSARSIRGLHIRDLLCNLAAQHADVIYKLGGHSMAAGLTIEESKLSKFQELFKRYSSMALKQVGLENFIETDGPLEPEHFTLELADLLRFASPWGQGFEEPLFDGKFKIINHYLVGQKHLRVIMQHSDMERYLQGIYFHADLKKWPNYHCQWAHIVYKLNVNEYQERKQLQLMIEYMEPTGE
jgi:single-stranded-DNA-specific exonuclease